jgi:hypothetical protein
MKQAARSFAGSQTELLAAASGWFLALLMFPT